VTRRPRAARRSFARAATCGVQTSPRWRRSSPPRRSSWWMYRQRQLRRLPRKESPAGILVRGPATSWPCLDTHRVEWIGDPVHLYGAPRVLHRRLDSPTVPPCRDVECHGRVFPNVPTDHTSKRVAATITNFCAAFPRSDVMTKAESFQQDAPQISTTSGLCMRFRPLSALASARG
jgi:hypothetical protein